MSQTTRVEVKLEDAVASLVVNGGQIVTVETFQKDGVDILSCVLVPGTPGATFDARLRLPCLGVTSLWSPRNDTRALVPQGYGPWLVSDATSQAPVVAFLDRRGWVSVLVAASEVRHRVAIDAGVDDHTVASDLVVDVRFDLPSAEDTPVEVCLRLDRRSLPLAASLADVAKWWQGFVGRSPAIGGEAARRPVCSTWYSHYQTVDARTAEVQARHAAALGFGTLIVDDGWQTHDTGRDYSFCGDWEPEPLKFPDMRAHIDRVHAAGVRYMLWLAPPLLGRKSAAWEKFSQRTLTFNERLGAGILDLREPDVREYLTERCARPVVEWGADGLKLDFLDSVTWHSDAAPSRDADCQTVAEGLVRLLDGIDREARGARPDLLVEFRQSYIGPALSPYGNLLRASDCPYDTIENHVRTLDLRLLARGRTPHSDPLVWHPDAEDSEVACQLMSAMFSVPQVSVRLDQLSDAHRSVLRTWLEFFGAWSDVLLDGQISASHPERRYPVVSAVLGERVAVGYYTDAVGVLEMPRDVNEVAIWNGGDGERVVIDLAEPLGNFHCRTFAPSGEVIAVDELKLGQGLSALELSPGCRLMLGRP